MHSVGKHTYNHFKTDTFYGVKLTDIKSSADFGSISWLEIGEYYPDSQLGMYLTMEKLSNTATMKATLNFDLYQLG